MIRRLAAIFAVRHGIHLGKRTEDTRMDSGGGSGEPSVGGW
ncbi:hypothetical protein B005_1030 [Nocardiopsis alba ATCC BAA-2165]|uniref:Uncharacterized protein n=1 Tax=Nocardiopsis alba (strain ATCC BAA-2165 / BE74) TaxID=1205910 RepID=J7LGA8_NOCAA|nr:hypothetical protein B005_1030 [Nocardiopsis alba ATCC BAA-2165]